MRRDSKTKEKTVSAGTALQDLVRAGFGQVLKMAESETERIPPEMMFVPRGTKLKIPVRKAAKFLLERLERKLRKSAQL